MVGRRRMKWEKLGKALVVCVRCGGGPCDEIEIQVPSTPL